MAAAGVIPVMTIDDVQTAVPLARSLAAGGLCMVEIVLRTPAALHAIRAIRAEVPECEVGAGTVLSPADLEAAVAAGAAFAVSPGFSQRLLDAALEVELPFMPAVSTSTEVLQAMEAGFQLLKVFPSELLGGPQLPGMLAGPFPAARFCCTGGITAARIPAYRREANVVAVGGAFMAPAWAVRERAWSHITELAAAAQRLWLKEPEHGPADIRQSGLDGRGASRADTPMSLHA